MNVRYLLALLCSPLAVAVCGTPTQAAVNLGFWVAALLIAPAGVPLVVVVPIVHAVLVVYRNGWDQRLEALVPAVQQRTRMAEPVSLPNANRDVPILTYRRK
jgi:hypothetical protein